MLLAIEWNAFLVLMGLGFAISVSLKSTGWGPEGPVGAGIVPVPFLIIELGLSISCLIHGRFDWIPGGKLAAVALILGVMIGSSAALYRSMMRQFSPITAIPFFALIGLVWTMNGPDLLMPVQAGRVLVAATLGVVSLFGFGYLGKLFLSRLQKEFEAADRQAEAYRVERDARTAEEVERFRALPESPALIDLLRLAYSENPTVENEARARIAARPRLDDELAELLSAGAQSEGAGWAASYLADIYPTPPGRLAAPLAHMFETAAQFWEITLQYEDYAHRVEPDITIYVRAAEKIQQAGGDLRPQLEAWHERVRQVRSLSELASRIRRVMDVPRAA